MVVQVSFPDSQTGGPHASKAWPPGQPAKSLDSWISMQGWKRKRAFVKQTAELLEEGDSFTHCLNINIIIVYISFNLHITIVENY